MSIDHAGRQVGTGPMPEELQLRWPLADGRDLNPDRISDSSAPAPAVPAPETKAAPQHHVPRRTGPTDPLPHLAPPQPYDLTGLVSIRNLMLITAVMVLGTLAGLVASSLLGMLSGR